MLKDYESRSKLGTPSRSDLGLMGVDWEERINFDRMRRQRLQRIKDTLAKTDVDMLFIFRTEDARYSVGFRLENDLITTDGDPDIYTTYPFDERFLDDVHPLDHTTGRTSKRLYDQVRDR